MINLKSLNSVLQLTPGSILTIGTSKKEYIYLGRNRKTRALEIEATGSNNYIICIPAGRIINCLSYKIESVGNYGVYVESISIDGEDAKNYYAVYQLDKIAHGPHGVYNDVDEALDLARDYHEEDLENERVEEAQEVEDTPRSELREKADLENLVFLYRRASENLKETEEAFNAEFDSSKPNVNKLKRLTERAANHTYYKSLISATIANDRK